MNPEIRTIKYNQSMQEQLLQTIKLFDLFSQATENDPERFFYSGYLFCKYHITLADDLKTVMTLLDRVNKLHITIKQKNNILQKLSAHQVQIKTIQEMEKNIFEYVDEVVPHLQLAIKLEKIRKQSLNLAQLQVKQIQLDKKQENLTEQQCEICLSQIQLSDKVILQCEHFLHKQCAQNSFKVKIDSSLLPLVCPFDGCKKQVSNKDIAQILSKQYQQKHETFSFKKYVEQNYQTMCWCPTIGCQFIFCFDTGDTSFTCPSCSKFYCLKCRSEYHIGMSCREYNRTKNIPQDDQKFYQFAQGARYKQCPKCQYWVQKSEGCHHMICRCQFEFCYLCGDQYPNCGCNVQEQAQRAGLALQVAAEQLRLISEGLRNHQIQLLRIRGVDQRQIQGQTEQYYSALFQIEDDQIIQPQLQQKQQGIKQEEVFIGLKDTKFDANIESIKIPSTSIGSGSDEKQQLPKLQFEFKQNQKIGFSVPSQKTFHRSPQVRKTFKTNIVNDVNSINNGFQPSLHSSRLEYRKSQKSLQKLAEKTLQRPIYHQISGIPKLTFSQSNQRKKSHTKC